MGTNWKHYTSCNKWSYTTCRGICFSGLLLQFRNGPESQTCIYSQELCTNWVWTQKSLTCMRGHQKSLWEQRGAPLASTLPTYTLPQPEVNSRRDRWPLSISVVMASSPPFVFKVCAPFLILVGLEISVEGEGRIKSLKEMLSTFTYGRKK